MAKVAPLNNPIKVKKTSEPKKGKLDIVIPESEIIKAAVDKFKAISAQMKNLDGELAGHKSIIAGYAKGAFAERQMKNVSGNFNILGNTETCQFQAHNSGTEIGEDEYEAFIKEHGKEAAEELLQINVKTVKFNAATLQEAGVMDMIVAALNAKDAKGKRILPDEVLDRLFSGTAYGVTDEVFVKARAHAKNAEDYESLMADLKVKRFITG